MKDNLKFRPLITVLMSVFNGERWLKDSITSVLNQSFFDFEFIIVDDGSTDDTANIIRGFQYEDDRIIVLTKANTGLAESLNYGIEHARGDWIARLDADDVCDPDRLHQQYEIAVSNPSLVFIGTDLLHIDEGGSVLKRHQYPTTHRALKENLLAVKPFVAHSSAFYRTEAVRSLGGYRPRLKRAQDWDLWLRLVDVGSFTSINQPLIHLRKHQDQISHFESGRRQIIDCRVALISFWLRRNGLPDPVSENDMIFREFHNWVAVRLEQKGLFEYFDYIDDVKVRLSKKNGTFKSQLVTIQFVVSKPKFIAQYFLRRLFGEATSKHLAREWSKKVSQCVV